MNIPAENNPQDRKYPEKQHKENYQLTMPQSIESEQALLGAILTDSERLGEVLEIFGTRDKLFYDRGHQKIFDTCIDLFRENKPIDIITILDRLNVTGEIEEIGGNDYIVDLAEGSSVGTNINFYAKIIKEKAVLRQLIRSGNKIAETAYTAIDLDRAIDEAQQAVFNISSERDTQTLTRIDEITTPVWKEIEERAENPGSLLGVPSGFNDLDSMTAGLQKSDLVIVAARPSMGKTAFCLNIAENVGIKAKCPVAIFSLEMSKSQLVTRMICSLSGVDAQRLRTGNLRDEDWSKISDAIAELSDAQIYIDDTPVLTVVDARTKARKHKTEKKDLGLIVIDYIQLMQGMKSDNRVQEISEISRGLKTLARELHVPIIALSQLSRSVEARQNKRPMLSDLRESGAIEQDADMVMFLYRHEYYEPEDTEHRGECEVIVAKQRNGPVGTIKLMFHGATTRFKNLEFSRV
ncbi:MAG: replicative DNA helicase [Candidatus Caenarcaniphilales bacterium]|nr:replicative DNA helicase [Candidatus Caenarcaniphilales bacterium]